MSYEERQANGKCDGVHVHSRTSPMAVSGASQEAGPNRARARSLRRFPIVCNVNEYSKKTIIVAMRRYVSNASIKRRANNKGFLRLDVGPNRRQHKKGSRHEPSGLASFVFVSNVEREK
jgi:hypothetical protein